MKRKLLNAALFGAVLIAAPVSTFVSCADYDDDFTTLNQQIDDLKDLVNKKEAAINDQIKNLDAQVKAVEEAYKKADADLKAQLEKAIKDGDAALQAQIEDCQAKCKAEFAAVRAELAAAKKELQDALAAAEKQHSEDVAKLLKADQELQAGIDKANADIVKANEEINNLKTSVNTINQELEEVYKQLESLSAQIAQVYTTLNDQITVLNGEIEKLQKDLAATKADLQAQITKNATDIATNKANLEKHIADFESHKTWAQGEFDKVTAELAKKATKEEVKQLEDALRALIQANANEISGLKGRMNTAEENISKLQAAVAGLSADVAKNTQAIVDNAARIVYLEGKISENATKLAALREEFEAYKVAQAAVDAAQDLALTNAVTELNTKINGVDSKLDTEIANRKAAVEKCYNDAVAKATELANLAEANAKAYTDLLANDLHTNYYTKTQIDALLKVINDDLDDIHEDLSLFHDDFNNFTIQTKAALFDINQTLKEHDERLKTNASRIEEVRNELLDVTDDLYRECSAIRDLITLRVNELNERIDAVEEAYKAADKALGERIDDLATALNNFKDQVAQWNKEISSEVKGFVLEPASYYEGIQAIEGTSYEYTQWDVTDALNPVHTGDFTQYCPSVTAHYHINPSAAVLDTRVALYDYAVLDRENRGGVNTQLKPIITKVAQNGGMLDVTMKLSDPSANKTPQGHQDPSEVTVMALQYTNPAAKAADQVVTSDYAVLYLNPLKEVSLVTNPETVGDEHEIGDQVGFSEKDYVQYNESYDIQAHILTSFGGEDALSISDNKWPEGFTYRYTWVSGDKNYFTPITAEGVVTPQLPNGQPATVACVGKTSTWRIDVMNGDKVAEVGFYTVTITGEAVIETAPSVVTDGLLAVTCDPTSEALNANLDLKNVWDLVASTTGLNAEDVKSQYALTLNADGTVQQFTEYLGEGDRVLYKAYAGKGVINKAGDQVNWVVLHNDPAVEEELLSLTKETKAMKTFIRVRSLDAVSKDTYNEFYLPLIWAPKEIEFWGEYQPVSWKYERVANQWQANATTGENYELRLYADLTDNVTPVAFKYDIRNKAMKGEFENKLIGTAKDFKNVAEFKLTDGHFRFIQHPEEAATKYNVGGGHIYQVTVSADGKQLLAGEVGTTPVEIATITPEGVVELKNNATSQLLLNAYEKDELAYGQTLCARVGYEVKCCAGEVKVVEGDFDVRFIKPITVVAHDIDIYDADDTTNSGIIVKSVLDQIKCFNNYSLAERPNYKELFQVYVDMGTPNEWYTNYDAAENDFSKQIKDHASIKDLFYADADKGEITYENNTAVVSDFTVIVPIKVINVWNLTPVETTIKLNVHRTLGNSNRR